MQQAFVPFGLRFCSLYSDPPQYILFDLGCRCDWKHPNFAIRKQCVKCEISININIRIQLSSWYSTVYSMQWIAFQYLGSQNAMKYEHNSSRNLKNALVSSMSLIKPTYYSFRFEWNWISIRDGSSTSFYVLWMNIM